MALLEVKNLSKSFGGIKAVDDCTFSVEEGSITGLIGPNGAGKSTAFNLISKVLEPDAGEVWFEGKRIDKMQPHQITRMGMSRTFQITRNLEDMTVIENLVVQAPVHGLRGMFSSAILPEERDRALELLEFLGITRLAYEETRNLSYGQKKLMDFAALLMAKPKLVLLDEPAGGVNPALLEEIVAHIKELNGQGITFLIVEHNMEMIMSTCNPIVVMAAGTVIAKGSPDEIQGDPVVLEAYLGETAS